MKVTKQQITEGLIRGAFSEGMLATIKGNESIESIENYLQFFIKKQDSFIEELCMLKTEPLDFMRPPTLKTEDISKAFESLAKTDLEKFKDLYDGIGVEYSENNNCLYLFNKGEVDKKRTGYYSIIEFDMNEKFIDQYSS